MNTESTPEKTPDKEKEEFLNQLYQDLLAREEAQRRKVRDRVGASFLIILGAISFTAWFFLHEPDMPDGFLMIKFEERLNERNDLVLDSLRTRIENLENPSERHHLMRLVEQLDQNTKTTIQEFGRVIPWQPDSLINR